MPAFPSYPKLLAGGFTEEPAPAVYRSEMESGPPKQQKRASKALLTRPATYLILSKADKDSFVTWFNTTVNRGADWFDWTDPYDSVVKSARIAGGKLDWRPLRKALDRWTVAMRIETWS